MPVISSARRAGTHQLYSQPTTPGQLGTNEIDNHADTICAGPNWRLLELTGEYCTVAPFSSDYSPKPDIPIARCATTYTCPANGDSVVLVADQVLGFGNDLHCSLINPHQIRANGHGV
ncbi:Reverse transcriptase (RNA-dependent DNA polymerase) [Fragilaria crotonensis]|nr:Reverse transcriptase (RNA-dependent DNA polymerase) [Fragilaria crotonensis]